MARGVFHWDPEKKCIVDGPAPRRVGGTGIGVVREDGVSFGLPLNFDDGSGKFRHLKDGVHKGHVFWESRKEAREIAKRAQDHMRVRIELNE